ncbi:MAG: DNA mismatch repair protein MutS, partial [Spirochaetia bacterium]|nr:DNA mismatch repair protein MutS [Spirochaetia bacterium]
MTKKSNRQDPLDTPVMRQYLEIKKQYRDCILLFRMGDFYELFLDDAKTAAPIMDVALTSRQGGVPMAGVPYHSADTYIARLIGAGCKVAVAEQSADPENPKLMRRSVRRVLSTGTVIEESLLASALHNYLMAVIPGEYLQAFALCDVSTGDFFSTQTESSAEEIVNFYCRYSPGEILVPSELLSELSNVLPEAKDKIVPMEDWKASPSEGLRRMEHKFGVSPSGLGYDESTKEAAGCVSLILHYLEVSFPDGSFRLDSPAYIFQGKNFMQLDAQTIRNLDLVQNSFDGGKDRSLLGVLDLACTNAGKRFLKDAVLNPLLLKEEILQRHDCVNELLAESEIRQKVRSSLSSVSDLERILSRI